MPSGLISYLASQFHALPTLLDPQEMEEALALIQCAIYPIGGKTRREERVISHSDFLKVYAEYVSALKRREIPSVESLRRPFSAGLSVTPSAFVAMELNEEEVLLRPCRPFIQLQHLRLHYNRDDKSIRTKVFGPDALLWGLKFSYPRLYQDPSTHESMRTTDTQLFPNTAPFAKLQRWLRKETFPTVFHIDGEVVKTPLRLGKKCREWVNSHPQLQQKQWRVVC